MRYQMAKYNKGDINKNGMLYAGKNWRIMDSHINSVMPQYTVIAECTQCKSAKEVAACEFWHCYCKACREAS